MFKKKNYVEVEAVEAEVTDVIDIPKKEETDMGTKNTAKVVKMIGAGVAGAGALGLAVWKIFFNKEKEDPDSDLSCEDYYDTEDEAPAADEEDFAEE